MASSIFRGSKVFRGSQSIVRTAILIDFLKPILVSFLLIWVLCCLDGRGTRFQPDRLAAILFVRNASATVITGHQRRRGRVWIRIKHTHLLPIALRVNHQSCSRMHHNCIYISHIFYGFSNLVYRLSLFCISGPATCEIPGYDTDRLSR
jgi:hypothetical protein